MDLIREEEIKGAAEYDAMRPDFRRRIMAMKDKRRVPVGDHITVHFETRDTMLYQVYEMLRAESSWDRPGAIKEELEAYNPLIPQNGSLSATMMIEYQTPKERAHHLEALVGLDDGHVWLEVADAGRVAAVFDNAQVSPTRISSVQYISWPLDDDQRTLLQEDGSVVRIVIDHPHYQAKAVLGEETRKELAGDLE
jgi:hypothetical protein